ncbi:hypothetical protein N752_16600 [Desulforamulus aquiferis]|nr:hypothetical protein N752_16600 [Desulforamulus aquiferis]
MVIDQSIISKITAEVLARVQEQNSSTSGQNGIFQTIDEATAAARQAHRQLRKLSLETREKLIQAMRDVSLENAVLLSEMAVKETGMGRVSDKILKNQLAASKTPGTEDLKTEAWTGDRGLTLVEMAPFGVIGSITPTTNPSETIINNGISMIAGGNSVVFSPHPTAKNTSLKTIGLLNEAIVKAGGPPNLLTAVAKPSLDSTNAMLKHPDINMLVATGGPAIVKIVMSSGKKPLVQVPAILPSL